MNTPISILAEIPEDLHQSLKQYLDVNPHWDQDRVLSAALSLFLMQNTTSTKEDQGSTYESCTRVYLETLFQQS
jgi:hypothetical protein